MQDQLILKATTDKLQALVEENSQMKLDLEQLLIKHQQQEYLLDEYKSALDTQIAQASAYKQQMLLLSQA